MSIIVFEGSAGTGKTTCLMEELQRRIDTSPMQEGTKVLGLTMMHGSRRRLVERLRGVKSLGGRFDCYTIDSFSWHITRRWRSLGALAMPDYICNDRTSFDYDSTCRAAAKLLERECVQKWVSATYPYIIVDETQDCKDGHLEVIKQLKNTSMVLAACDDFQDLFDTGSNPAVEWLHSQTTPVVLKTNHRTSDRSLVEAFDSVRLGNPIRTSMNLVVLSAFTDVVASKYLAGNLKWKGQRGVAILSPVNPERSAFVRNSIARLGEQITINTKKGQQVAGPYHLKWESDSEGIEKELITELGVPEGFIGMVTPDSLNMASGPVGVHELRAWFDRQRRLHGTIEFTVPQIRLEIKRISQSLRAFHGGQHVLKGMTIHQAKNREFIGVLVLWPYEVKGDPEKKRRLLYNAITRAREWAVVIIQDPRQTRRGEPPFSLKE